MATSSAVESMGAVDAAVLRVRDDDGTQCTEVFGGTFKTHDDLLKENRRRCAKKLR